MTPFIQQAYLCTPPGSPQTHRLVYRGLVPGTGCGLYRENSATRFARWNPEPNSADPSCQTCREAQK